MPAPAWGPPLTRRGTSGPGVVPWSHDDDHTVGDASCRPPRCPVRGGRAMGRGRAKAKQQKVARALKYSTHDTDLTALQRELKGEPTTPPSLVDGDEADDGDEYDPDDWSQ